MKFEDVVSFIIEISKENYENRYHKCKNFIQNIIDDQNINNDKKADLIDIIFKDEYKSVLGRGRTTLFDSVMSDNFFSIKYPELNELLDENIPYYGMYNFGARSLKDNIEINKILKYNNYNLEDSINDIANKHGWIHDNNHVSDWRKFYTQNEIKKFINENIMDKQLENVKEKIERNGFHKTLNKFELK